MPSLEAIVKCEVNHWNVLLHKKNITLPGNFFYLYFHFHTVEMFVCHTEKQNVLFVLHCTIVTERCIYGV